MLTSYFRLIGLAWSAETAVVVATINQARADVETDLARPSSSLRADTNNPLTAFYSLKLEADLTWDVFLTLRDVLAGDVYSVMGDAVLPALDLLCFASHHELGIASTPGQLFIKVTASTNSHATRYHSVSGATWASLAEATLVYVLATWGIIRSRGSGMNYWMGLKNGCDRRARCEQMERLKRYWFTIKITVVAMQAWNQPKFQSACWGWKGKKNAEGCANENGELFFFFYLIYS